jgi:hypothetical protein
LNQPLEDEPYNAIYNLSSNEDYHKGLNIFMNYSTINEEAGSIGLALYVAVVAPGPGTYFGGAVALYSLNDLTTRTSSFIRNPTDGSLRNRTLLDHGITAVGADSASTKIPQ